MSQQNKGKVLQVIGAVVDINFEDNLPLIHNALQVKIKEKRVRAQLNELGQGKKLSHKPKLSDKDIAKLVSSITGIPSGDLSEEETKQYLSLENNLSSFIGGQKKAISDVSRALRRNRSGIGRDNKPIGSFIFLGPSGVGKTELARILAQKIFLSGDALVKIDMSEFMEKHNLSRLVGAPPGYVGFENAGKLTEAVRRLSGRDCAFP